MQIKIFSFLLLLTSVFGQTSLVNTKHLDALYEEAKTGNTTIGFIHIYAEAPDYHWVVAEGEGMACIDDAARAAVFYMDHYSITKNPEELNKIKNLINFNIYMQAPNGYFYNFIWKDLSINKDFKTSVAEANWWSWRALWALSEGALFFKDKDKDFYNKLMLVLKRSIDTSIVHFNKNNPFQEFGGYKLPAWFNYETAYDQASILIKTLSNYYQLTKDEQAKIFVIHFGDGLLKTQFGNKQTPPYNAFLSWQNTWHAWGNSQAFALLFAGQLFNKPEFIKGALNEINDFYPFLFENQFYSSLTFSKEKEKEVISDSVKFSQIAYGIKPMVFASLKAWEITKDEKYLNTAVKSAMWLFGDNPAKKNVYDINTGITFDGINSETKLNLNSGAESTIEALMLLNKIEKNKEAKAKLLKLIR